MGETQKPAKVTKPKDNKKHSKSKKNLKKNNKKT